MSLRIQCVCIGSAVSWVVLADPNGNEFCVLERWPGRPTVSKHKCRYSSSPLETFDEHVQVSPSAA
jgi:hypothetical protein